MSIPCEIIVWYVLPIVRKEMARELVEKHDFSQAEVARTFGVTDAAISQYLKRKRGDSTLIENASSYQRFIDEIYSSAKAIADNLTTFEDEICRICKVVWTIGLLEEIYNQQEGIELSCKCAAD